MERGKIVFAPNGCFPDPYCRCCECQGIHCLVPHPGHSHRTGDLFVDVLREAERRLETLQRDVVEDRKEVNKYQMLVTSLTMYLRHTKRPDVAEAV